MALSRCSASAAFLADFTCLTAYNSHPVPPVILFRLSEACLQYVPCAQMRLTARREACASASDPHVDQVVSTEGIQGTCKDVTSPNLDIEVVETSSKLCQSVGSQAWRLPKTRQRHSSQNTYRALREARISDYSTSVRRCVSQLSLPLSPLSTFALSSSRARAGSLRAGLERQKLYWVSIKQISACKDLRLGGREDHCWRHSHHVRCGFRAAGVGTSPEGPDQRASGGSHFSQRLVCDCEVTKGSSTWNLKSREIGYGVSEWGY